jgi:hypothetical protein
MKVNFLVLVLVLNFSCDKLVKKEEKSSDNKVVSKKVIVKKEKPVKNVKKIKKVKKVVKKVVPKDSTKPPVKSADSKHNSAPVSNVKISTSPKLEKLLKVLKGLKGKNFEIEPVFKKHVYDYINSVDNISSVPEKGKIDIIEIRHNGLIGAFIGFTPDGFARCKYMKRTAFSILEVKNKNSSILYMKQVPNNIFYDKKVKVTFSPNFEFTKAFYLTYTYSLIDEECVDPMDSPESVTKHHLFKAAKRKFLSYKIFDANSEFSQPGNNKTDKTLLAWHKSIDKNTYYLSVTAINKETFHDTCADCTAYTITCERSVSVYKMTKNKYWKELKNKKVEKLQKTEPTLKSVPKYIYSKSKKICNNL